MYNRNRSSEAELKALIPGKSGIKKNSVLNISPETEAEENEQLDKVPFSEIVTVSPGCDITLFEKTAEKISQNGWLKIIPGTDIEKIIAAIRKLGVMSGVKLPIMPPEVTIEITKEFTANRFVSFHPKTPIQNKIAFLSYFNPGVILFIDPINVNDLQPAEKEEILAVIGKMKSDTTLAWHRAFLPWNEDILKTYHNRISVKGHKKPHSADMLNEVIEKQRKNNALEINSVGSRDGVNRDKKEDKSDRNDPLEEAVEKLGEKGCLELGSDVHEDRIIKVIPKLGELRCLKLPYNITQQGLTRIAEIFPGKRTLAFHHDTPLLSILNILHLLKPGVRLSFEPKDAKNITQKELFDILMIARFIKADVHLILHPAFSPWLKAIEEARSYQAKDVSEMKIVEASEPLVGTSERSSSSSSISSVLKRKPADNEMEIKSNKANKSRKAVSSKDCIVISDDESDSQSTYSQHGFSSSNPFSFLQSKFLNAGQSFLNMSQSVVSSLNNSRPGAEDIAPGMEL